ncbi:MAG: DNA repair protein RadC, partial [Pseudomonadota bacterium]
MSIQDWPKSERPRERLMALGPAALSDAELLAILIGSGTNKQSALAVARHSLGEFGGLRNLFRSDVKGFCQIRGLGPGKYALLQASMELCRRHLKERLRHPKGITGPGQSEAFLKAHLRDRHREVFCCLFLDNRHRMVHFEELFAGTLNGTPVYPREVVRIALKHRAAAVILAHNHPSGVAEPSQADHAITHRLTEALNLMDIRVL